MWGKPEVLKVMGVFPLVKSARAGKVLTNFIRFNLGFEPTYSGKPWTTVTLSPLIHSDVYDLLDLVYDYQRDSQMYVCQLTVRVLGDRLDKF